MPTLPEIAGGGDERAHGLARAARIFGAGGQHSIRTTLIAPLAVRGELRIRMWDGANHGCWLGRVRAFGL